MHIVQCVIYLGAPEHVQANAVADIAACSGPPNALCAEEIDEACPHKSSTTVRSARKQ